VRLHPSEEVVEVRCSELEDRQPPASTPAAAAAAGSSGRDSQHQNGGGSSSRGREERNGREEGQRHREQQERGGSSKRPGAGAVEAAEAGRPPDKRHRSEQEGSRGHGSDRHADGHHHHHHHKDSSSKQQPQQQPAKQEPLWVAPLIRVRLLDKKASGGALYLKKAVVVDVHPGGVCDLRVEGSGQLVTLPQRQLETVVPKEAGASVLVVAGKHRGRRGRVLQSSTSKGAVAVQLSGDMVVVQMVLDDVAQYMGSLDGEDDM
jgi:G patch domain/KOW motif-containing protein